MKKSLFVLCLFILHKADAQTPRIIYSYSAPDKTVSPKPKEGFVVLNSSDTLKGEIQLGKRQKSKDGLSIKTNGGKQFIAYSELSLVRLFAADSKMTSRNYTDFMRINSKARIWRKVGEGNIEVFDDLPLTDERPGKYGSEIVVKENGCYKNLWNFWSGSTKADVVNYINDKYQQNFRKRDFTLKEAINYLVEKG